MNGWVIFNTSLSRATSINEEGGLRHPIYSVLGMLSGAQTKTLYAKNSIVGYQHFTVLTRKCKCFRAIRYLNRPFLSMNPYSMNNRSGISGGR